MSELYTKIFNAIGDCVRDGVEGSSLYRLLPSQRMKLTEAIIKAITPLMGGGESLSPLPALQDVKEAIDALPKLGRINSARTLAQYNFQLQQVKAALTEIIRRQNP